VQIDGKGIQIFVIRNEKDLGFESRGFQYNAYFSRIFLFRHAHFFFVLFHCLVASKGQKGIRNSI
jgi:hypothetical protein